MPDTTIRVHFVGFTQYLESRMRSNKVEPVLALYRLYRQRYIELDYRTLEKLFFLVSPILVPR